MKMKKKGKRIKNAKGETLILPEEVIQHIQSFMSGKEAARTTILSKSWYAAWLTRPTIDLNDFHFGIRFLLFEEFGKKTMQRYQDSSLKIESFSLRVSLYMYPMYRCAHNLILSAIKMGATNLNLNLPQSSFILPQEVLGSQTLVKLFLRGLKFDKSYAINCLMLKSLTLDRVVIRSDDVFKDLTSRCVSMEELTLSVCFGFELRRTNTYELRKLRRLCLYFVNVDNMFFTDDFASRFPCLKDLTIHECKGCSSIHIAATSLHTISFEPKSGSDSAKFDIPNIRKFTYSASGLPSNLSINGASSWEWELDISVPCFSFPKTSWLVNLKKLLNKFTRSRISLSMNVHISKRRIAESEREVKVEVVPNPLVVEKLTIGAPHTFCCALLVRSFGAFCPKFLTLRDNCSFMPHKVKDIDIFSKRLIQALVVSNWQEKFGQFGLKRVNVEISEEFDAEWRPLQLEKALTASEAKVRLQLIWED